MNELEFALRVSAGLEGLPAQEGNTPDTWCIYYRGDLPCVYGFWKATPTSSHHSRWSTPIKSAEKREDHYLVKTYSGSSYILFFKRIEPHRDYEMNPSWYKSQGFTTSTEALDALVE
jgi:hypothetical protein